MKQPISWHEKCLDSSKTHLNRDLQDLESLQNKIRRQQALVRFREQQIAEAKRRGLKAYDETRLLSYEYPAI